MQYITPSLSPEGARTYRIYGRRNGKKRGWFNCSKAKLSLHYGKQRSQIIIICLCVRRWRVHLRVPLLVLVNSVHILWSNVPMFQCSLLTDIMLKSAYDAQPWAYSTMLDEIWNILEDISFLPAQCPCVNRFAVRGRPGFLAIVGFGSSPISPPVPKVARRQSISHSILRRGARGLPGGR
jgi:hypothetical protein